MLRNGDAARFGAAPAQRVIRRRGRREPARGGPAALAVSTGSACTSALRGALVCPACPGPRRRVERKQPALRLGPQHHRARCRHGGRGPWAGTVSRLRRVERRMNYNEVDPALLRDTPARGSARRGPASFAARPAAARRAPGCNSICRSDAGIVRAARFLAFGCPHIIAVAAWLAEQAAGGEPAARRCRRACSTCASVLPCRSRNWAGC